MKEGEGKERDGKEEKKRRGWQEFVRKERERENEMWKKRRKERKENEREEEGEDRI